MVYLKIWGGGGCCNNERATVFAGRPVYHKPCMEFWANLLIQTPIFVTAVNVTHNLLSTSAFLYFYALSTGPFSKSGTLKASVSLHPDSTAPIHFVSGCLVSRVRSVRFL